MDDMTLKRVQIASAIIMPVIGIILTLIGSLFTARLDALADALKTHITTDEFHVPRSEVVERIDSVDDKLTKQRVALARIETRIEAAINGGE